MGLDLMGPLQDTEHKMSYIMTLTDLFSKFVVADALPSKCGYEVAKAITAKFYLFGPAKKIITDRGKEFVNEVNKELFSLLNIRHAVTSAYHPQSNGQDERTNQNVKSALRRYVNQHQNDWDQHLQAVIYGINTAKQDSTKYTPFEIMFNRKPGHPGVINACPMGDKFEMADPEEGLEQKINEAIELNKKVARHSLLNEEATFICVILHVTATFFGGLVGSRQH